MTTMGIAEVLGMVISAAFGSAGFWSWIKSRSQKRAIYSEAFKAGVEGSALLDKRAVSLLDPYVQQVEYLTRELEASREESRAARAESRLSREESQSLRTELAAAMKRIADLERILIIHGLAVEGGT